ncbi:MAG: hypothetical protein LBE48_00110 [Methanomassiliicoccaceae archaeon]|jgi:hypothetical protein|nr:hypothetical protein [Methanomassiliicoccaceae archaeon]
MSEPSDNYGGTAHGLTAYAEITDVHTADMLDRTMVEVAQWIKSSAGCFLGHVKMAITTGTRTTTFNLTDLKTGVEHHGPLDVGVRADIRFMAAVVDVDHDELAAKMKDALVHNGFKIKNKNIIELG